MAQHRYFMGLALRLAQRAGAAGEVPVGAVVVENDEVIGEGANACIARHDPTAHAEIVALRAAARARGNYRLARARLYVTLEPCQMCAGACVHARLAQVIFAAADPRTGAAGSVVDALRAPHNNHWPGVLGGVLSQPAGELLQQFFAARRSTRRDG